MKHAQTWGTTIAALTLAVTIPLPSQMPPRDDRMVGPVAGDWEIVDRQRRALSDRTIDSLVGTTLYVSDGRTIDSVEVGAIARLERAPGVGLWTGVVCGAMIGGVVGGLIGYASYSDPPPSSGFNIDLGPQYDLIGGASVGFIVGGVTGWAVSAFSSPGLTMDLTRDDAAIARSRVHQLFRPSTRTQP